ncbi:Mycothione reductase, partial [Corchorus capsularis]
TAKNGEVPEPDLLFLTTFGKDGVLPKGRAQDIVDEYRKALAAAISAAGDDLEV